jgi:ligand-binding sensor domain-containing protein/anti-sigma regulatory factor (Ser/Thr protein kinase)
MSLKPLCVFRLSVLAALAASLSLLFALNPQKEFTQYTRTLWTQAQGLPQDTIRAIAQTPDGYLWLGTREGLARFDGSDFLTFSKSDGALPNNTVTALAVGPNGTLWIGTLEGVSRYQNGHFRVYSAADGLPIGPVNSLVEDQEGALWVASGGRLFRLQNAKATVFSRESLAPLDVVQVVYEDPGHKLWISGVGGLLQRAANGFTTVLGAKDLNGEYINALLDSPDGFWMGGSHGVILMRKDRTLTRFGIRQGLPDESVDTLIRDRAGNVWVGTGAGLSRFQAGQFVTPPRNSGDAGADRVWSILEDREGDLWVGTNSALERLRDDRFLIYGRPEGMPSDEPTVVHQDRNGNLWVGYHDAGLLVFGPGSRRLYTTSDGLPSNQIFSIREARNGDLLVGTADGLSRLHDAHFYNDRIAEPLRRHAVYELLEVSSSGKLLAATSDGVFRRDQDGWHPILQGDGGLTGMVTALVDGSDGNLWVGMFNNGLWRVQDSPSHGREQVRKFTTRDGLGSNQIRSLYRDRDGTLWIGTFGGGLNALRKDGFHRYESRDGMLSDNVSHVEDDGKGNLWLSTTRGISEISKQQLQDFDNGATRVLRPQNFGIQDGLRSAQCAPGFPTAGGGTRTRDGHLWFPTSRGLATLDPKEPPRSTANAPAPMTRILEILVDGSPIDPERASTLKAGTQRIQFRYTGVYLSAPERVTYATKLEGIDKDWVPAGAHHTIAFSSPGHGHYRFLVRSMLPEGNGSETEFSFQIAPHFYETTWFITLAVVCLLGSVYSFHRLHLRQVNSRFALVLEERTRLAREIHDTLAQNFIGISSQLDTAASQFNRDLEAARKHLDLARKMTRHSFTEARRAVMELRASEMEGKDLPAALASASKRWVEGSSLSVEVQAEALSVKVPTDLAQNILRIAQEAVTNSVKHSRAEKVWVELQSDPSALRLRVKDDGSGFELPKIFHMSGGHFGILGMGERAQRFGGEFKIQSRPGVGTEIEVTVPIEATASDT